MIPLREQEYIRQLFEEQLTGPVKLDYFTQRPAPVFVPGREECRFCGEIQQMLEELSHLSPKVNLRVHEFGDAGDVAKRYDVTRVPATVIRGVVNRPVLIYGLPGNGLFPALIELVVAISRGETGATPAIKRRLKRLKRDVRVEVFTTPDDPYGPRIIVEAATLALENSHIRLRAIEIAEFPALAEELSIQTVPLTLIDGRVRLAGPAAADTLLEQIVKAVETPIITGPASLPTGPAKLDLPKGADDVQRGEVRPSGLIIPRR